MDYGRSVTPDLPSDKGVDAVRHALAEHGFCFLTESTSGPS